MHWPALSARRTGPWAPVSRLPAQWQHLSRYGQYFRNLLLQETHGLTRDRELVEAPLGKIKATDAYVVRIDRPDKTVAAQLGLRIGEGGRLQQVVQFQADVAARGASRYLIVAGAATASPPEAQTDLAVGNARTGRTWKNKAVTLEFHPDSGQLTGARPASSKARGKNTPAKFAMMEHNGVGYFDGVRQYTPMDWVQPRLREANGPVALTAIRDGLLPGQTAVHATIQYTLPAGSPYLLVDTTLEFSADVDANTVYNNYCTFGHNAFTQANWQEMDGAIGKSCIFLPPEKKRSRNTRRWVIPERLAWVTLANHAGARAVATLHLAYDCDGQPARYKARFDVCANASNQWWTRFPVHGECDEADERRYREMVPIRAGSVVRETNAYLFCPWEHATGHGRIDMWYRRLALPLRLVDIPFQSMN